VLAPVGQTGLSVLWRFSTFKVLSCSVSHSNEKQSLNFLGNHILKNNVRLDVVSYCSNTWNLFYIAIVNPLDNAEMIQK